MKHILLQNSFKYKKRVNPKPPTGFFYDKTVGAWLSQKNKSLLVLDKDFPSIGTKKNDVETGEDQKGA